MSKQAERNTAAFQAVYDSVQDGSKLKDAIALTGVSQQGFWKWCGRHGLGKAAGAPKVMPTSAQFKNAEREIRQRLSIPAICEKHGITNAQLYAWRRETGGLSK